MECKNCASSLSSEQNYCAACGAKVIHNRLTFKNHWRNLSEQFLSVDNIFLKTFFYLFTKPKIVIGGILTVYVKKTNRVFCIFNCFIRNHVLHIKKGI